MSEEHKPGQRQGGDIKHIHRTQTMTTSIRETIQERLVRYWFFPEEAAAIMALVEQAPENEAMKGRWHEPPDNYPQVILNLAWFSARQHAVEWIDSNKPKHPARLAIESSLKPYLP